MEGLRKGKGKKKNLRYVEASVVELDYAAAVRASSPTLRVCHVQDGLDSGVPWAVLSLVAWLFAEDAGGRMAVGADRIVAVDVWFGDERRAGWVGTEGSVLRVKFDGFFEERERLLFSKEVLDIR